MTASAVKRRTRLAKILTGAWPYGVVEAFWRATALIRFRMVKRRVG